MIFINQITLSNNIAKLGLSLLITLKKIQNNISQIIYQHIHYYQIKNNQIIKSNPNPKSV